ncbi:MAG: glycosyltransferase family 2 protein [Candidatus Gastranaerophilales bacterium]|nr:glycosyltransferase family 2 protein [Candidatus Gastranaerophilales bacterium]
MNKKLVSIVTPCYNEEKNVEEIYLQVKGIFEKLDSYEYEHIFIDNSSKDKTVQILKEIAQTDKNVKIIVNSRNFGQIRSPYHAMLQASGDAVILMASDLQEPPVIIFDFIKKWEENYKIVVGVKTKSEETPGMFFIRKLYYFIISRLSNSNVELIKNFNGFGLYDRQIIEIMRQMNDPLPYIRGLICEIGFEKAIVEFTQPTRKRGISANNFYSLYDYAMLGITSYSKVPLRIAAMLGFCLSILSIIIALGYFIAKLVYWQRFSMGIAPMIIGLFFFGSVQLFFTGVLGEYIGAIYTKIEKRPLVVEKDRINF